MRHAYLGGAPGLGASAVVWLLAGVLTVLRDPKAGMLALVIGGMSIHPLAVLACRLLGRPGAHRKENSLAPLALESTAILLLGVFLAFVLSGFRVELFFPVMLIVIGGRYLTFQTLYGWRTYWFCGIILAVLGVFAAMFGFPVVVSVFGGALIEAAFALLVFARARGERPAP